MCPQPELPRNLPTVVSDEDVQERLRRLESVTDVALSRLEVDELLPELLERVRDLLQTDTAAILLMDESSRFLVATAARGIEEEVLQGSRVPVGRGFAGRIAAERSPVVIDDLSRATVVNPLLRLKGIRSMAGVPLLAGDATLGVLHVGSLQPRTFTQDEVSLLEQVADRATQAIKVGRSRSDAVAAETLQRSLSPRQLPSFPGLDLAARYVPGNQLGVGGDWYDVFSLPDGLVGLVIGDVMGHGLPSAVVMGRLRSALRAYALESTDPSVVLTKLDRKIQHFEPGQTATVIYAVYNPSTGNVQLSTAGHPPPVLTRRDAPCAFVDLTSDLLLGVETGLERHTSTVALPPGSGLCLFTDGLVERRGERMDDAMAALLEALDDAAAKSVEEMCAEVMVNLVADRKPEDDVALLMVNRYSE